MTIIGRCCRGVVFTALCVVSILGAAPALAEGPWPDLSSPARAVGGGEHDAAVVVGAESSAKLPTGVDATRGEILEAVQHAVKRAGPDVTCALPGSTSASRPEGCGSA